MVWVLKNTITKALYRADFGDVSVVVCLSSFRISGDERQAFKMVWLEKFQEYVLELERTRPKLILCGDYNICHEAIDIHDPIRMPPTVASCLKSGSG